MDRLRLSERTSNSGIAGMGLLTLHHFVEAVVVIVLGRHLQGAARTFSLVKGERPTPALQLFALANFIVIYKAFATRVDPRLAIPGLIGFACSLALFEFARRTIRGKFFSYAFSHDLPQFLLTSGPYCLYPQSVLRELSVGLRCCGDPVSWNCDAGSW